MTSSVRIRPLLRAAAFMAALCALLAPATAGASVHAQASASKKKVKLPVVTRVSPMSVEIGQTLNIRGKNFITGRYRNTVVFKRSGGRAVFVKAKLGTKKLLKVTVPKKLEREFTKVGTTLVPTRFRIRILTKKLGKKYTKLTRSPLVGLKSAPPPPGYVESQPDGDCDNDGTKNRADADDDNDGLTDTVEASLNLNPCNADTDADGVEDRFEFDCDRNGVLNRDEADDDKDLLSDGLEAAIGTSPCTGDTDQDGVEDGFEFKSAQDLNDDDYQQPNTNLPYPGPRPYPNALFADAGVDYDGDVLTLLEEYRLWKKYGARTLDPLYYSDGEQYSISRRITSGPDAGRREPTLVAATYSKRAEFIEWANGSGYRSVELQDGEPWYDHGTTRNSYGLFDVNRSNDEDPGELYYNDVDGDGFLSDDERDEDADGLTNYDETHGRMTPVYWQSCYSIEKPYYVSYDGTDVANGDTDGDGVRDGADDNDHDDIPNLMELSRFAASGINDTMGPCKPREDLPKPPDTHHPNAYGRINPFNPCLPFTGSRTCARYVNGNTGAPYDGSPNWYSLN